MNIHSGEENGPLASRQIKERFQGYKNSHTYILGNGVETDGG